MTDIWNIRYESRLYKQMEEGKRWIQPDHSERVAMFADEADARQWIEESYPIGKWSIRGPDAAYMFETEAPWDPTGESAGTVVVQHTFLIGRSSINGYIEE